MAERVLTPRALPPSILSIQVGLPARHGSADATDSHDAVWTTGFFKMPVAGPVFAGPTNLVGDGQADLVNHGGIDKAVLAYSADHYGHWRRDLGRALPHGAFGENLTIAGLDEASVHIGDVLRIGEAQFEVSQPRQPCWKLARRWRMHELPSLVIANGRSGWYLRVIKPGWIASGMPVTLLDRPNADWPVARANRVLHHDVHDAQQALELANVPRLSDAWSQYLHARADRLIRPDPDSAR